MIQGNADRWRDTMLDIDEDFLVAVLSVWGKCRAGFGTDSHEDRISENLVLLLKRRRRGRIPYRVIYQPSEVEAGDDGRAVVTGRHDLHLVFDLSDDDASLIYECKRLNVVKDGKRKTLATEYVQDGMMRFVRCQYAPRVRQGGMLGYVMDGELGVAATKLDVAIEHHRGSLKLMDAISHSLVSVEQRRFESMHLRESCFTPFLIRHLLLPVVAKG